MLTYIRWLRWLTGKMARRCRWISLELFKHNQISQGASAVFQCLLQHMRLLKTAQNVHPVCISEATPSGPSYQIISILPGTNQPPPRLVVAQAGWLRPCDAPKHIIPFFQLSFGLRRHIRWRNHLCITSPKIIYTNTSKNMAISQCQIIIVLPFGETLSQKIVAHINATADLDFTCPAVVSPNGRKE